MKNLKIKITGGTYDSDIVSIDADLSLVAKVLELLAPHVPPEEPEVPETEEDRLRRELAQARSDAEAYRKLAQIKEEA